MKPNQNQFYKIVSKSEYSPVLTAQGADGYPASPILSTLWYEWENQRFMFVPLNNNYYAIVDKIRGYVADPVKTDPGKWVMTSQWHGGDSQQWSLHDLEVGYQKIKNKLTGLVIDTTFPTNPNVLMSQWHGGDSQQWLPEAVESFTLPSVPTYPVPAVPQYENIHDILPEYTQKVTTHYTLAPLIAVGDPHYGNNTSQQIKTNPYYLYVRKQYWKRVASHTLAPNETHKYLQTTGMTQEDQNIVSTTVGHTIGADVGFQFGKEEKSHSSASLSYQYTTQLATQESHTTTQLTEKTAELQIVNTEPYMVAWTKYVLVSEYSVQRSDGTLVREPWTVVDPNTTGSSFYPPKAKLLDN
ncbi:RICIN domain-containing protein [Brevibacillus porteri]|uniref:RICIN domain-containing protein n=1 Tax=Brevibacillus porteri TaxID=2126350 RepID=UPI003D1C8663